jgi:hypothetical protein
MKCPRWVDAVFPLIEPLPIEETRNRDKRLANDLKAINAAQFSMEPTRALDEAQRVAGSEIERVRTAESKATTYLVVLAALVPLVITLQTATWEDKSGPSPEGLKLIVLFVATTYLAAAGFHAFKTLQVSGFQRVMEREIADAWRTPSPLNRLAQSTLRASRNSREAVNEKVTRIKVTHQHLVRAFGAFVVLLSLDPAFYAAGSIGEAVGNWKQLREERALETPAKNAHPSGRPRRGDHRRREPYQVNPAESSRQAIPRASMPQPVPKVPVAAPGPR